MLKRTFKFKLLVFRPEELEFLFAKWHEFFLENLKPNRLSDREIKQRNPNMFFGHIQSARRCADGHKKSLRYLHTTCDSISKDFIILEQKFVIENNVLKIAFISFGRGRFSFWLSYPLLGKTEKLKEGEVKAVTIVRRNREYFAYIIIEKQAKELYKPSTFLGVDRGLKNVAVASLIDINGMTIHNPWFFAGGKVLHKRRLMRERKRIFGIVKRLDRIKDVRREESNFVRDINHKVSRQIVDIAFKNRSAIVLEDLEGIQNSKTNWGKEGNYMKSSWSYGQLRNMILYKAEELGVPVIFVNPRNTSKTCSKCGQIGERKSLWFSCHSCGYQYNADANASQNIAERGREQVLSSPCACEKGIVEMPIGR